MATSNFNITSADANAIMVVDTLFPAGITLEMFATDTAITQESIDIAETRMGVDGRMVAGYIPNIKNMTINLEASSPSTESFRQIAIASDANKTIYECVLTISVPSINRVFTFNRGVMKTQQLFPNLETVLAPTVWAFDFESCDTATLGILNF